jgi:hypothetical protein
MSGAMASSRERHRGAALGQREQPRGQSCSRDKKHFLVVPKTRGVVCLQAEGQGSAAERTRGQGARSEEEAHALVMKARGDQHEPVSWRLRLWSMTAAQLEQMEKEADRTWSCIYICKAVRKKCRYPVNLNNHQRSAFPHFSLPILRLPSQDGNRSRDSSADRCGE